MTVPRRSARRHEGVAVHRSTKLTANDVTVVNNIPCTTVARTLLDLGEVVTGRQLERSFDQAEIAEVLDLKAIQDQLARNPTRPGAKAFARSSPPTTSAAGPRGARTRRRCSRSPGRSASPTRTPTSS
ncbi:MAG TPA: hypothetical protein VGF91_08940 [Solirubrobacteraceae bacterium]